MNSRVTDPRALPVTRRRAAPPPRAYRPGTPRPSAARRPEPPRPPRTLRLGDGRRRVRGVVLVLGFVLSLFAGRLFQVQAVEGTAYTQEAIDSRMVSQKLYAVRGSITDRHGVALATSVQAYDVEADPVNVKNAVLAGRALSPILGVPAATITSRIATAQEKNKTATKKNRWVQLAQRLPAGVRSKILALKAEERAGITLRSTSTRAYPSGSVGSNIVGFVRDDGSPGAGLEQKLDPLLKGKDGKEAYEGSSGAILPTGTETISAPVDGGDVQLTLDRDIQWKAQQEIALQVRKSKAAWGSIIVLDAKTGEIYAMANSPGYDPNNRTPNPAAYTNQAVANSFEPGSTSKVMTVATALEEGKVTPSTVFTVPDHISKSDRTFHDDETHRTWHPTVTGILAKSSNVGTIKISQTLTESTLETYLRKFGMGSKPGTGLEGETRGIFTPSTEWSGSQRWTIAFGQGIAGSLLQTAGVYQTLANGGLRIPPTVIKAESSAGDKPVPLPARTPIRVVSAATAKQMMSMIEAVTYEGGTGKYATIPGYRVGGKTGTAQVPGCGSYCGGKYQSSFVGVLPADKPRLVVAVTISVPTTGSHFGGTIAAPVFTSVGAFALSTLNIPPSGSVSPKPDFGDVRK